MKDIIKTLLYEWKERVLPDIKDREIDLGLPIDSIPRKIRALTGLRRVGKTYFLFQILKEILKYADREEVIYLNFEDERIPQKIEFLSQLLPTIKETFQKPIKYLFLDEIQDMPSWSKWLRRIYDTENIHLVITGSSSKLSSYEIPTELRGRCLETKILPLSLKEFLHFKEIHIDNESLAYAGNMRAKLFHALNEYLLYGSMPEVVLIDELKKNELLQQYYKTIIQKDIIERHHIKNQEGLKALLRLLLHSNYYSFNKLYTTLKSLHYTIGKTNLLRYVHAIEDSYFLQSISIFSYTIKDQIQYPRKAYFIDNGFLNALSTKFSLNTGRLYENLVARELQRKKGFEGEIYYWKDSTGKEVDFIVKNDTEIIELIQVCSHIEDADTKKRELKGLLKANQELHCDHLTVITSEYDATELVKGAKIRYIPMWKWLLNSNKI